MKIQAKSSRRTIPPHPDVVRLVQDLQAIPKNELAAFIRNISYWKCPRSELHVWFGVLDRFDEIMESLISQYDAANLQLTPFSEQDKELLFQILRFERMLLDNSTNRKLFNSYDRLSILVMSPDVDIAIEALSLILRPAHQYTLQISLNIVLRVSHTHLEYLARSWPVLREHSTTYTKLVSPQEDVSLPPEASDLTFQWYSPKAANANVNANTNVNTDNGPHHVHLKALATDQRDTMVILQDAIDNRPISVHDRFDLMCRIRVAKSLAKDQLVYRSKLVTLRLLAIAVYCHTHTETTSQNARLLAEPDIVTSTAPLLAIDKGISESVQAAAVHSLDGICHHRFRATEVLSAVNASVAHGLLMSLFRKTVLKLDEPSSEPSAPLFEALQNFLDFLTTHEVSYNMVISAGLIEHLRRIIANRQSSRSIIVARTIPLLENALYGPPQGISVASQRNNNPFTTFMSDNGIQFLLDRIKFEVDSDIAEYQDDSLSGGPPLGYGKVPTPQINVLKHLLRTIQRMLQSAGSAEVLRLLPEPDSSFIPSLKNILDNRNLFGSTILAAATLVIATWVHNEPSSLTIIQESKLPDSFYDIVEQGVEPMIEVVHGVLNAMGALSLNQAGQTLLQSRPKVIPMIFSIFTSELHVSPLQEKSNASLIGGDADELVRHHPWLKEIIFKAIMDVMEKIEALARETKPKEGTEGHFNLIPVPYPRSDPAAIKPSSSTAESLQDSIDDDASQQADRTTVTFDLQEMPVYQYINNFSKFLVGFFNHAQHCREIVSDTKLLEQFDTILTLPCWPVEFPLARNLEAILLVNRRLADASPAPVLKHRVQCVKKHMDSNEEFRQSEGSSNKLVQYVGVTASGLEAGRSLFSSMRTLLLHLILLNDVYSQSSSHSIHQPFRREPVNMLGPLVETEDFIPLIGQLFRASAWEILHLRQVVPDPPVPSVSEQVPVESSEASTPGPSVPAPSTLHLPNLPGNSLPVTALPTPSIPGVATPGGPSNANAEHPFAEFIPRKRLLAPQEAKGKVTTPEERNHMNIKSVLHAFSNVLQSIFTGVAKALPMPRRLPVSEASQFKKDSAHVTSVLAEVLVEGLEAYHAADDPVVVMGYCALAISSTSCIGPESRHGQNMQTGLFLDFEETGGVKAVIDVCTFCADLIDSVSAMSDEDRKKNDKEIMGVAHYFLRHPLIWFYHLACGKPLIESPQTQDIVRSKSHEGFDPAETVVRLRLELLPIFKRFWEAKWLPETSESVRKAIIFGLLAILKGEYEDSARVPSSHLAMPGLPAIMRRIPQPLSPASIQQLTDMGFPESAARNALTRARGDPIVATEYLLANAHLFDSEEQGTEEAEEINVVTNDVQPTVPAEVPPLAGQEPIVATADTAEATEDAGASTTDPVEPEVAPAPPRDYAKELAEAREELKKSIVPNALRLADANPTFVDDIRDVFIGPTMNANAKFLIQDIKQFSNGIGDIPEIPLQVRCRILALAYLKSGTKGLGLSKEDANELLQSLLALLLSGPVPGTATEPNVPKWLSSHMLLSDRIMCSSEDIEPVTIPKDGDPLPKSELLVGPSFTDSRAVLFDFCMRLARIPDLHKDDLLSLFGVLSFLTKDYNLATKFIKNDGLNLVLRYFKNHRQQEDVAAVSMGIFRHLMEDPATVENFMRQDVKRWSLIPRHRPGENISNYLRSLQHAALRDPQTFIKVTSEMCELVESTPGIGGGYRIRPKTEISSQPDEETPATTTGNDPPASYANVPDESAVEMAGNVIHHLTSEMMQQYKQSAEEPIAMPTAGLGSTVATSISGISTPTAEPRLQTVALPDVSLTSTTNMKDVDYAKLVQNILCELLLSYEACKTAFLLYPKRKPIGTPSKEATKLKHSTLNFLLQEIMTAKGDSADWSKRKSRSNPFHSMIVALCSDVVLTTDVKAIPAAVINARKIVVDAMTKAMKEASIHDPNDTAEQRYGRFIALGDLCHMLLTTNPHVVAAQRVPEESLFHMAKLMLEKNVVSTLSAMLSEVDLTHPMSSTAASAILAPLETLTKASIKIGRVTERTAGTVAVESEQVADFSTDSEESALTETEEAPDPYSTSALGMYGGETDGAFADVEEPIDEDEEDDVEMDYGEDEYGSEESNDEDTAEALGIETGDGVDIPDDEETDPEDDEDLDGAEDEEEEEEGSEGDDDESESDQEDEPPRALEDDPWQELEAPRNESGVIINPDEQEEDDDDDDEMDEMNARLDGLDELAYAINGGDMGAPPMFMPSPGGGGNDLGLGDPRLLDLDDVIVDHPGQNPNMLPLDAVLFDPQPDDFARNGTRRAFRGGPHIIRTSMLQEMLGGPTAQMLQEMARNQNGDIHLALSGPAAQLLIQEAGLDTSQFRNRMLSRYMPIRSGRGSGTREGGLSSSMSTAHRWAEEARVNAGPSYDERLAEFNNHVIVTLLPAAREAARIEAEAAKLKKEADEKEKAEREAREKAEAEEKARLEAEAAIERQREQQATAAISEENTAADMDTQPSLPPEIPDNQTPDTTATTDTQASTSAPPRVTVMYRGESVDITDADIDPDFLNAVPEDIRDEIIGNFVREQQRQTRPTRAPEGDMDMEFLNALPAEMREEVLRSQMQTIANIAGAVDMDAASVLATLTDELRQTVLLEQDDAILEAMPSSVLAEANALRAQRMTRRALPTITNTNTLPGMTTPSKKPQNRETAQLLDKSGLAHLVRLLFYIDDARRVSVQQVLVNLSENGKSRTDLLNLLLGLLSGTRTDLSAIDKSFSQLSMRSTKSSSKGKQREDSTTFAASERAPEEHVVVGRTLDTLTLVVQANEAASHFFLTEQDMPLALQRAASKKGKGKEKIGPGTYYPFVQLLTLLERQNMAQQVHSLDSISGLLCTVTKPLVILREPVKSVEPASDVVSPPNPVATEPSEVTPTEPVLADTQETPVPTAKEDSQSTEAIPVSREDAIRAKPPQFPEPSLRLVVNLLTIGECSSRCFQNTQTLIYNLSSLPSVREVIIGELQTKAEEFGKLIQGELDVLLKATHSVKKGEELPSSTTTKFSLPTSNQARLLRILKILENVYMATLPGRSATIPDPSSADEKVAAIYERLHFAQLWKKLSDCLKAVEDRPDATHVATFLLPLIESLMVVCKSTAASSQAAANKTLRASASPRSPTIERESSGEIFVTFTDRHRKVLNLMVRNKPSLMNGSFSLLVHNPRVLDFDNKRNYFVHKLRHRTRSERERESYPTIAINVRRKKVFEDSFQSITRLKDKDLKYGKLNIRFSGEEGVDAGGVTREWFRILAREIFNPNYALFSPCGADRLTYQPNPASGINPDHLRYFKFVGRILGKAIYDQRLLDGHFARSVYRQLLGKPVNYRDLEWSDPPYYNGLRWMLDNSVASMDLTFSEQNDQLGEMVVVDLKPNGRNIAVTDDNKDEYIQLIAEYRLTTSIKEQLDTFLEGFYEIVPKEHIAIFDEKEVELLISGTPDIEVEDWRSATEYHGYSASDAVIVWWWRALKSFSRADRAKVLSFATGTAKVPLGGFSELQGVDGVQRFSIHKDYGAMDRLPQAHTCFNQIDLPQYSSYEKLRQQLLLAINEGGEGFGFA